MYSLYGRGSLIGICMLVLVAALAACVLLEEQERSSSCVMLETAEHSITSSTDPRFLSQTQDYSLSCTELSTPRLDSTRKSARHTIHSRARSWVRRKVPLLLCLQNASLLVAFTVCIVQGALVGVFDATISLIAKNLFGLSPGKSALFFVPIGSARLATGFLAGMAVDRFGPSLIGVIGYSFLVPNLLLFGLLRSEPRAEQMALYCVLLASAGVGMGSVSTVSFVEAGNIIRRYHKANPALFGPRGPFASLYGLNLMVYSLGMALGSLMTGTFQAHVGYGNMMAVLAGSACLAAFACHLWLEDSPSNVGFKQSQIEFITGA